MGVLTSTGFVSMLCAAVGQPVGGGDGNKGTQPAPEKVVIPAAVFPNPVITEVLFAVPSGQRGDANKDGARSPTGDEFVELFNPHDKPIDLAGYRIVDLHHSYGGEEGKKEEDSRVEFAFPALTLQPGEVVVVFNGFESRISGAVGTKAGAAAKNEQFGGAYVFSMGMGSKYQAFSNTSDTVALLDPSGAAVEAVRWGESEQKEPAPGPRTFMVPETKTSVQRREVNGAFVAHTDLDGEVCSPGRFGGKVEGEKPKSGE